MLHILNPLFIKCVDNFDNLQMTGVSNFVHAAGKTRGSLQYKERLPLHYNVDILSVSKFGVRPFTDSDVFGAGTLCNSVEIE